MKQNMPTPAYAPQQTAYIQPCAGQLSYKSLLVKKNSAQLDMTMGHLKVPSMTHIFLTGVSRFLVEIIRSMVSRLM